MHYCHSTPSSQFFPTSHILGFLLTNGTAIFLPQTKTVKLKDYCISTAWQNYECYAMRNGCESGYLTCCN